MGRDGAGVRAASETSIEITFAYRGERCRERIKLKPTPANLKRAERHRAAIIHAIETGTFDYAVTFPDSPKAVKHAQQPGDVLLVRKYLDEWLKGQKQHIKSSTYNDYRKSINNHLIPKFGDKRLSELKRRDFKDWCKDLKCSVKRISNLLSPMRVALQHAVEDELIEMNPLFGWSYTRVEPPKETDDIDPFSIDEQTAILRTAKGQALNLCQFALWTGMRTSELVALDWGDIDWIKSTVDVRRALTQAADDPEEPKTTAGRRTIKLFPLAIEALKRQKEHSLLHESGRVFLNPRTNAPWEGDQAIRKTMWTPLLKLAGVRYRKPYQTRHTFASMLLSAGESVMWVAKQMGHKDWTVTARVYARWMPDAAPTAGEKALAIFGDAIARNVGKKAGIP